LLAHPEIDLYVLRPSVIRLAIGAATAEDLSVTYEVDDEPPSAGDAMWREHRDDSSVNTEP
jgi:hypothetical protein